MRLHDLFRCITLAFLVATLCGLVVPRHAFGWSDTTAPVNPLRPGVERKTITPQTPRALPQHPVQQVSAEGPILETAFDDPSVLETAPDTIVSPRTDDAVDEPELIDGSGEVIYEDGEIIYDERLGGFHGHGLGHPHHGCNSCFSGPCGAPHHSWVHLEYLMWWTKGMSVPPLVTTADTLANASLDPNDNATILFGGDDIFEDLRKGGRIRLGFWLDSCQRCGIEGEFLGLHDEQEYFQANTFDHQVLARPFFDVSVSTPGFAVQEVSGAQLAGQVEVNATTRLYSGGIRLISNQCCNAWGCAPCSDGYCGNIRRDFLLGYRFTTLDEALGIREQLNTVDTGATQNFDLRDNFVTDTQFHGIDFGWQWEFVKCRWSFNLLTKIAMGVNRQVVDISGSTQDAIFNNGAFEIQTQTGGLLTQPSNIANYSRSRFSVMPELAATLGYELRPGVRLTAGYTFLYWTNVVRPGDQIDLSVNSEFLNGASSATPSRPAFNFRETDYWAQGLNFGIDLRF